MLVMPAMCRASTSDREQVTNADGRDIGERSDAVLRTAMGERSDAVLRTAMPAMTPSQCSLLN